MLLSRHQADCRIADGCGYPRRVIVRWVPMSPHLPSPDLVNPPIVLFVADEPQENLAFCALALMGMGLMTLTAGNAEAYERASLIHPDVIVAAGTHYALRNLTRQLRDDPRTREARLVVMPGPEASSESNADGAYDRLIEPNCPPDVLAIEIVEVLRSGRRRAS